MDSHDTHEVAWAAGFFDGEGTTTTTPRNSGRYLTVCVGQKDRRPLDRFVNAVRVGRVLGPYRQGCDMYVFKVYGLKARAVIDVLWPYLSEPKREQADAALRATTGLGSEGSGQFNRRKTHCPQGHPYDDANTLVWNGTRACRACRAVRMNRWYEAKKQRAR